MPLTTALLRLDCRSCINQLVRIWVVIAVLASRIGQNCAAEEATIQDLAFVAECDQSEQRYVQVLPVGFEPGTEHDLLIALHGHGADRWQFARDPRAECRAARDIASEYRMVYVCPDYRAKTSWMGPKAELDMVQIIQLLTKQYRVGRVFISGGSMGGTSALTFAVRRPEMIDGVISMNGTANLLEYPNFSEAIQQSFGGSRSEIPLEYKSRSAEYWPEKLTMPIACTTGGRDTLVPSDSVRRLVAVLQTLKRPVQLIHRDEGGHDTTYQDAKAAFKFVIDTAKLRVSKTRMH